MFEAKDHVVLVDGNGSSLRPIVGESPCVSSGIKEEYLAHVKRKARDCGGYGDVEELLSECLEAAPRDTKPWGIRVIDFLKGQNPAIPLDEWGFIYRDYRVSDRENGWFKGVRQDRGFGNDYGNYAVRNAVINSLQELRRLDEEGVCRGKIKVVMLTGGPYASRDNLLRKLGDARDLFDIIIMNPDPNKSSSHLKTAAVELFGAFANVYPWDDDRYLNHIYSRSKRMRVYNPLGKDESLRQPHLQKLVVPPSLLEQPFDIKDDATVNDILSDIKRAEILNITMQGFKNVAAGQVARIRHNG